MRKKFLLTGFSLFLVALVAAACSPGEENTDEPVIGMANPASVYCEEQGGVLEIRNNDEGQIGMCIFPDGSECEEWAFYRGECASIGRDKETTSMEVTAVYGYVISPSTSGPSESILVLMPEGFGSVSVIGENPEIEDQIASIRDKPEPANKANFWGKLDCPPTGDCLLTVSRMRIDGPGDGMAPDVVEAWEGVIYNGPPGPRSGGDDYFALLGAMPFEYGIWAADETLLQQLESLRDSGQAVRIWGELHAGRMDWNAAQIVVTRIELINADASTIPPAPNW